MANRDALKQYFLAGEKPTEEQFAELITNTVNNVDDKANDADATAGSDDIKYITSKSAKKSAQVWAPVKTVNGMTGNVVIPPVVNITGNASTASALQNPVTINGVSFNGASNINIPVNAERKFRYETDFFHPSTPQNNAFTGASITGGSLAVVPNQELNHPGQYTFSKATTVNSGYVFGTYGLSLRLHINLTAEVIFKLPATADRIMRFGFHTSQNANDATSGAYFQLTNNALAAKTANASVYTTQPLITVTANTWYHCRVTVISATLVRFQVFAENGTQLQSADITTTITANSFGCFLTVTGSSAVAEGLATVDYMALTLGNLQRGSF